MRIEWFKFDDYVPARITKKSLGFVPFLGAFGGGNEVEGAADTSISQDQFKMTPSEAKSKLMDTTKQNSSNPGLVENAASNIDKSIDPYAEAEHLKSSGT